MSSAGNRYVYVLFKKLNAAEVIALSGKYSTDGAVAVYRKKNGYGFHIFNKDGSKAKFCGNAACCVAKLLRLLRLERSDRFAVFTDSGRKKVCVYGRGKKQKVRLEVGYPHFLPINTQDENAIEKLIVADKNEEAALIAAACVHAGNRHLVIFVKSKNSINEMKTVEQINASGLFPDGINVEFACVSGKRIFVSVCERGSGRTLSCGSGAAAVFYAAKRKKLLRGYNADIIFSGGRIAALCVKGKVYIESKPVMEKTDDSKEFGNADKVSL